MLDETKKEAVGDLSVPTALLKTSSGSVTMPLVGLGTWKSKPGDVQNAVEVALRMGYRHVDCAAIYENEQEVGAALKSVFQFTTLNREDVLGERSLLRGQETCSGVAGRNSPPSCCCAAYALGR